MSGLGWLTDFRQRNGMSWASASENYPGGDVEKAGIV
jgi:hypothetical protein